MREALEWLGYGLCHQLPERSFFGGGLQAPVCARDTGIYVGFALSFVVITLLHRGERPREFPRPYVWLFFAGCLLFMGWDGVTSYAGMRPSNNVLRLMTGMGTGFSAAGLIVPMLNDVLWRIPGHGRLFQPSWRFGVWVASLIASTAILWYGGPMLGVVYPVLIGVAIIVTLALINLVIIGMMPWFDRAAERPRDLTVPVLIAVALAFAEVGGAWVLRVAIVGLASR